MKIPSDNELGRQWWREYFHLLAMLKMNVDLVAEYRAAVVYADNDLACSIALKITTGQMRSRLAELIDHIDTAESTAILVALTPE